MSYESKLICSYKYFLLCGECDEFHDELGTHSRKAKMFDTLYTTVEQLGFGATVTLLYGGGNLITGHFPQGTK